MPVVVAQITAAESRMLSAACSSIFRASARSERASSRSCFRSPGFGAVRRCRLASRKRLIACLTSLRANRTSRCASTSRSSVCSRSSGNTRAGCPSRTTRSPKPSSRSKMLSTARLLGAQAKTLRPRRIAWRMTSTTVVVLPVPGGPWISPTSRAERANCTASSCTSLSERSSAPTARSTPNSGCRWPRSTSRRIAARSPRSTRACSNAARCRCVATSSKAMSTRQVSCSPSSSGRPSMATEIDASLRRQTTPR